jgi:site-specific DNA-adenine methylase
MTAVEWLYEQIKFTDKNTYNELYEQYQQALELEKEQIIDAINSCTDGTSSHCQDFEEWFKTL